MADRIIPRHDTKARWAEVNPILMEGEWGIVIDDPSLYKVGDGFTAWNDLPFRGYDGNIVQATGDSTKSVMSQAAASQAFAPKATTYTKTEVGNIVAEAVSPKADKKEVENLAEATNQALEGKADKDGTYERMRVGQLISEGVVITEVVSIESSNTARIDCEIPAGEYLACANSEDYVSLTFRAIYVDDTYVDIIDATRHIKPIVLTQKVKQITVYSKTAQSLTIYFAQLPCAPWNNEINGDIRGSLNIPIQYSGQWFEHSSRGFFCSRTDATIAKWGISPLFSFSRLKFRASMADPYYEVAFLDEKYAFLPNVSIISSDIKELDIDLADARDAGAKYVIIQNRNITDGYFAELYSPNSIGGRCSVLDLLPIEGLKVLIFGDSITDCATISVFNNETTAYTLNRGSDFAKWPYILSRLLKCSDLRNYALSGASYCDLTRANGNERQNISYQVELAINDRSNPNGAFPTVGDFYPDIIIFAAGVNDESPADTLEDMLAKNVMNADGTALDIEATLENLDRSKFHEAVRWSFLKIKREWPESLIMCSTPIQSAAQFRQDKVIGATREALVKVSELHAMPIIDSTFGSGICQSLEVVSGAGVFLKDGLHPNADGQKQLARCIINGVKNNYISLDKLDY